MKKRDAITAEVRFKMAGPHNKKTTLKRSKKSSSPLALRHKVNVSSIVIPTLENVSIKSNPKSPEFIYGDVLGQGMQEEHE